MLRRNAIQAFVFGCSVTVPLVLCTSAMWWTRMPQSTDRTHSPPVENVELELFFGFFAVISMVLCGTYFWIRFRERAINARQDTTNGVSTIYVSIEARARSNARQSRMRSKRATDSKRKGKIARQSQFSAENRTNEFHQPKQRKSNNNRAKFVCADARMEWSVHTTHSGCWNVNECDKSGIAE